MGHFFEKEITTFLAEETDEDKRMLKTGFCDWFWKWELVDTGVSDLKKQVQILKHIQIYYINVILFNLNKIYECTPISISDIWLANENSFFVLQSVKSWIEYVDYEMETKFDEGEPILEGGYSKLVDFLTTSLTGE